MDKTRVVLTAISSITVVLILFICGMSPNIDKKTNAAFQMETGKTGAVTWACLKHNGEYIGCNTVEKYQATALARWGQAAGPATSSGRRVI